MQDGDVAKEAAHRREEELLSDLKALEMGKEELQKQLEASKLAALQNLEAVEARHEEDIKSQTDELNRELEKRYELLQNLRQTEAQVAEMQQRLEESAEKLIDYEAKEKEVEAKVNETEKLADQEAKHAKGQLEKLEVELQGASK